MSVFGQPENLPYYILYNIQGVPKCSRMLQNVSLSVCVSVFGQHENLPYYILLQHPGCSRMFKNVQECSRMIQNDPEWSRMFQNNPECFRMNVDPWACMHVDCKSMSLTAGPWAYIQVHELACRPMSLHAVTKACMKFHGLVCSSFLCLSSSREFGSACIWDTLYCVLGDS